MTAFVDRFALIGRSFPSEGFEGLLQAYGSVRAERRGSRSNRAARVWRASGEALVLPKRLSA